MDENHFRKLERLYYSAPTNRYYQPEILIGRGTAEIRIKVRDEFFHSGAAVHGSVIFKALDDAAYFASNSLVGECMLVTVSFSVSFIRPVTSGVICARGTVIQHGKKVSFAESSIIDERGRVFAKGSGSFMRSEVLLSEEIGYK